MRLPGNPDYSNETVGCFITGQGVFYERIDDNTDKTSDRFMRVDNDSIRLPACQGVTVRVVSLLVAAISGA